MELPRTGAGSVERDVGQAITALKKGSQLLKYGRRGKPKFCPFRLSNDETTLIWFSGKEERQLKLSYVTRIVPGQRTANFQRYLRPEKEYQSFSLIYSSDGRSLDLICKDKDEAEVWFVGLKALVSSGNIHKLKIDTKSEGTQSSDTNSPMGRALRDSPISPYGSSDNFQDSIEAMRGHSPYGSPSKLGLHKASSTGALQDSKALYETGSTAGSLHSLVSDESFTAQSRSVPTVDAFRISMSSAVSSSSQGSAAEDGDALGDVFIWGEGIGEGILGGGRYRISSGAGSKMDALVPKALQSTVVLDVSNIACGSRHAALVSKQGEVFCWGEEAGGRLGHGIDADISEPQLLEALTGVNVDFVACGEFHSCAVTLAGDLYTWGDGTQNVGLLGHGDGVSHWMPKRIIGPLEGIRISSVACGPWHTALVTSAGQLFTFGDGTFGVLGHGDKKSVSIPKEVESLKGLRTVRAACGIWHTAAVVEVIVGYSNANTCSSGKLFTWGDGDKYRLGHGDKDQKLVPTCVAALVDYNFRHVACGHSLTVALATSGRVFTMGSTIYGQLGEPQADGKIPGLVEGKLAEVFIEEIDCGAHHVAVLSSKGEVYTWGKGANGRLGHGDVDDRNTPTLVEALKDKQVKGVACGSSFTAVVCLHKSISGADQSVCSGCKQAFGFTRKRHNCYNCGLAYCHGCTSRKALKASLAPNLNKAYRVCDPCFVKLENSGENVVSSQATLVRRSSMNWRHLDAKERPERAFKAGGPTPEQIKETDSKFAAKKSSRAANGLLQWGSVNATNSLNTSLVNIPKAIPDYKVVSRAMSPLLRRPSPPRSATPNPTRTGLAAPKNVVDELKKKNESLCQEVLQLKNQIETLTSHCELRERELQRSAQKVHEAVLLAGEETAKCRAAKEVIKSLTAELKDLAERLPGAYRHLRPPLPVFYQELPNGRYLSTEANDSTPKDSKNTTDNGAANHNEIPDNVQNGHVKTEGSIGSLIEPEEWVEQDQPGVYVTLAELPGGGRDLKRVRFSRRRFSEREAEQWWQENRQRVHHQHNIRGPDRNPS